MRNLALLCLVLILGYSIAVMASVISVMNSVVPMIVQAAADAWWTLMLEALIVMVISLTVIALTFPGLITRLILGSGFLILFETLKELLGRSP